MHIHKMPWWHPYENIYKYGQKCQIIRKKEIQSRLGVVAHICNPSTLEGRGEWITWSRDRDHPGRHSETLSLLKIQKLAGCGGVCLQSQLLGRLRQKNHLNPEGRRLQQAKIVPLHSSLGDRVRCHLKKKSIT